MTIHVTCQCGGGLTLSDEFAGMRGYCPACRQPVYVPLIDPMTGRPMENQGDTNDPDISEFHIPPEALTTPPAASASDPLMPPGPGQSANMTPPSAAVSDPLMPPGMAPPAAEAPPVADGPPDLEPPAVGSSPFAAPPPAAASTPPPVPGEDDDEGDAIVPWGSDSGYAPTAGTAPAAEIPSAQVPDAAVPAEAQVPGEAQIPGDNVPQAEIPDAAVPAAAVPSDAAPSDEMSGQPAAAVSAEAYDPSKRYGEDGGDVPAAAAAAGGAPWDSDEVPLDALPKPVEEMDELVEGYQPDAGKVQTVHMLAMALVALTVFAAAPALRHLNLVTAPGWARVLVIMSAVQILYVAWLVSLPDWSTVWIGMVLMAVVTAIYAAGFAVVAMTPETRPLTLLDLEEVRDQAGGWCLAVTLLTALLTYACGRVSSRWRKAFELAKAEAAPPEPPDAMPVQ